MNFQPTAVERLILANQYRILAQLEPARRELYARSERMLLEGHAWSLEHAGELELPLPAVPDSVVKFVIDVLAMYRALNSSIRYHGIVTEEVSGSDMRFEGFDGNNENDYLAVVEVLKAMGNQWEELLGSGDLNSHHQCVPMYQRMLSVWHRVRAEHRTPPGVISRDDLQKILAARMHVES